MKGNKKFAGVILLLLVATVLVSGCAQGPASTTSPSPTKTTSITSKEDAAAAVPKALEKTDKALGALEDIKQDLGG